MHRLWTHLSAHTTRPNIHHNIRTCRHSHLRLLSRRIRHQTLQRKNVDAGEVQQTMQTEMVPADIRRFADHGNRTSDLCADPVADLHGD